MDKKEPMLQIRTPKPIVTATTRSVTWGALKAINADRIPIKLKRIRSIWIFGSVKTALSIR